MSDHSWFLWPELLDMVDSQEGHLENNAYTFSVFKQGLNSFIPRVISELVYAPVLKHAFITVIEQELALRRSKQKI